MAHLLVPRDVVVQMLRREHEIRTSAATQALYAAAETSFDTDWMEVGGLRWWRGREARP
jgi:hypothetical protein